MDDDSEEAPDLARGVAVSAVPDGGILAGKVGKEDVLLFRSGDEIRAVGATCTHLGAPLAEGLVDGDSIRCPWHHACFSLRSGEALRAPAFDPLACWKVERQGDRVRVAGRIESAPQARPVHRRGDPVVIVGGGAAGFAAADGLLRGGCGSEVVMLSADTAEPYDRTLLTKDYLDGQFGDEELPISERSLTERGVRLELGTKVEAVDAEARQLRLADGGLLPFGRLMLATGAEPKRLDVPGAELPHVHLLRSLADCRAIVAKLDAKPRIAVLGGSFIGLEAAASLRDRELEVQVVAPEKEPMARQFGAELSRLIVDTHRRHGVTLHLGRKPARIEVDAVILDDGSRVPADLVLVGIGVTPRTRLAEQAGLEVDGGVIVDGSLRTSHPQIWAVGDIARWPDPYSGRRIRVEHWAVAERQGRHAAAAMLGETAPFDAVPFFWTKHFDLGIRYLGHADEWDELAVEGDVMAKDALVRFRAGGRDLAIATVGRDLESLQEELAMERRLRQKRPGSS